MEKWTNTSAGQALQQHVVEMQQTHMRKLFAEDKERFRKFSIEEAGIFLDYSKNILSEKTLQLLCDLASELDVKTNIQKLFNGAIVNRTEHRPALHTALRASRHSEPLVINGEKIHAEVYAVRHKMRTLSEKIHAKEYLGFSGKPITDVLHVGIGGSDLGPAMAYRALIEEANAIRCHFISTNDIEDVSRILGKLHPETTLAIIVSKSFTTEETLANAQFIQKWFKHSAKSQDISRQLLAVTAYPDRANAFGIDSTNVFPFWEWVGGRYSIWSAVSLSLALSIGIDNFERMLAGAEAMDQHFQSAEFTSNLPVLLALIDIWNANFLGANTKAVIPYCRRLELFPDFLQQLQMESLGKSVTNLGEQVDYQTGNILWGGVGTNSQHSFHQLLFQGTQFVPIDFILPLTANKELIANCIAQGQTFMQGYTDQEIQRDFLEKGHSMSDMQVLLPHKRIRGNNPCNTLLLNEVDPYTLGALIAMYEHKVFVQGVIWNINPFDQWGVERGKTLSKRISKDLQIESIPDDYDSSTAGLMHIAKTRIT